MALENGGKVQPWLRAALAQELVRDNAVSVNDQRMNSNWRANGWSWARR